MSSARADAAMIVNPIRKQTNFMCDSRPLVGRAYRPDGGMAIVR
jgi:hypothetical protein